MNKDGTVRMRVVNDSYMGQDAISLICTESTTIGRVYLIGRGNSRLAALKVARRRIGALLRKIDKAIKTHQPPAKDGQ